MGLFTPTQWVSGGAPGIDATNLNRMDSGIGRLYDALTSAKDLGALSLTESQGTAGAPTGADSGVAGNPNGTYLYMISFITGWQKADGTYYVTGMTPGTESASVTVSSKEVNLSNIPIGNAPVIGRAIYRTAPSGASGSEKFAGVIWDNTTTSWADNVADSSLGTGMPTTSGMAIPTAVPTSDTTGTSLSGDIDAATLGGHLPTYFATSAALNAHESDTSNPHQVTYGQVGALGDSQTAVNSSKLGGQSPSYYGKASRTSINWMGRKSAPTGRSSLGSGLYTYGSYNDGNTPEQYGNVISFGNGSGGGQSELFIAWDQMRNTYVRSLRDTTDDWTSWGRLAFASEIIDSYTKAEADQNFAPGNSINYGHTLPAWTTDDYRTIFVIT